MTAAGVFDAGATSPSPAGGSAEPAFGPGDWVLLDPTGRGAYGRVVDAAYDPDAGWLYDVSVGRMRCDSADGCDELTDIVRLRVPQRRLELVDTPAPAGGRPAVHRDVLQSPMLEVLGELAERTRVRTGSSAPFQWMHSHQRGTLLCDVSLSAVREMAVELIAYLTSLRTAGAR